MGVSGGGLAGISGFQGAKYGDTVLDMAKKSGNGRKGDGKAESGPSGRKSVPVGKEVVEVESFEQVMERLGVREEREPASLLEPVPGPGVTKFGGDLSICPNFEDLLSNASAMEPGILRDSMVPHFQSLLAEGLLNVPAPRNLTEWEKLFNLWWKASGLGDAAKGDSGSRLLSGGKAGFGRRAVVVDVHPGSTPTNGEDDDGFEYPPGM